MLHNESLNKNINDYFEIIRKSIKHLKKLEENLLDKNDLYEINQKEVLTGWLAWFCA